MDRQPKNRGRSSNKPSSPTSLPAGSLPPPPQQPIEPIIPNTYSIYQYSTHYDVLGIPQSSDMQTVRGAYRQLFFLHHPDRNGGARANIDFITRIQKAYEVLGDESLRRQYDLQLNNTATRQNLINYNHLDGLETCSLDEFDFAEDFDNNTVIWQKDCPRCRSSKSIMLSDWDLENNGKSDNDDGYIIVVQCSACSLCIKVRYYDLDD